MPRLRCCDWVACDTTSAKGGHCQLTGIQEICEERGIHGFIESGFVAGRR